MKNTHILFIVNENEDEHLGLMSLSSMLKLQGYTAEVVKARHEIISEKLTGIRNVPAVLAYSPTSFSIVDHLELNKRIKREFEVFSVFGGYYLSGKPGVIEYEGVDAVCIGEGEYAFLELLDTIYYGKDPRGIPNLWIKHNNRIYKNPLRPLITDLNTLPFPDRSLFKQKSPYFYDRIYIMTSRGCTYACPHCYNSTYKRIYSKKNYYRRRSVDNVIAEIKEIRKRQPVKFILFYDDIFILMPEWLEEFSDKYKKEINIPFRCNVRIDLINRMNLKYLKEANCHNISFGLETGNDSLSKAVLKRDISSEKIIQKTKLVKDYGIKLRTSNMIGIRGGSIEDDLETVKLNIKCSVDYALVSMFRSYPKTDFSQFGENPLEVNLDQSDDSSPPIVNIDGHYSMSETSYLQRLASSFCLPEFGFKTAMERRMISNLHELFTLAANFPFFFPVIKILIKLPLKRLYIYVNLFWSWYCSFFILYPTCGWLDLLKRTIRHRRVVAFRSGPRIKGTMSDKCEYSQMA